MCKGHYDTQSVGYFLGSRKSCSFQEATWRSEICSKHSQVTLRKNPSQGDQAEDSGGDEEINPMNEPNKLNSYQRLQEYSQSVKTASQTNRQTDMMIC